MSPRVKSLFGLFRWNALYSNDKYADTFAQISSIEFSMDFDVTSERKAEWFTQKQRIPLFSFEYLIY